ncbi:hypothetical protein HHX47_DHR10000432 [Lentinula edodes]|nr:hypothetical protein HHX47_DHR10000432 [Lentinula edodes]
MYLTSRGFAMPLPLSVVGAGGVPPAPSVLSEEEGLGRCWPCASRVVLADECGLMGWGGWGGVEVLVLEWVVEVVEGVGVGVWGALESARLTDSKRIKTIHLPQNNSTTSSEPKHDLKKKTHILLLFPPLHLPRLDLLPMFHHLRVFRHFAFELFFETGEFVGEGRTLAVVGPVTDCAGVVLCGVALGGVGGIGGGGGGRGGRVGVTG